MVEARDISQLPFVRQYNKAAGDKTPNAITAKWLQQTADPFQFGFQKNPLSESLYGKPNSKKPLAESLRLDSSLQQLDMTGETNTPSDSINALSQRLSFFASHETQINPN